MIGEHRHVRVNGIDLHYVEAGLGDPVLLLGGWPQTWFAWRRVVPLLVGRGRRVIVLDPRGFGDSAKPSTGYDLDTVAADVHAFIVGLDLPAGIDVVSHDVGSWIAFAHACAHPTDMRRLVLSEMTVQTPDRRRPLPDEEANVASWHFAFNRLSDLPEALVAGRERLFLDWLFDRKAKDPAAIDKTARDHYVRAFAAPGAAQAGFEYYRALMSQAGLQRMRERLAQTLTMPILTIGARKGVGMALAKQLRGVAPTLRSVVLDQGHYLPEEAPTDFVNAVADFWAATV